jgi:hypothetical protein
MKTYLRLTRLNSFTHGHTQLIVPHADDRRSGYANIVTYDNARTLDKASNCHTESQQSKARLCTWTALKTYPAQACSEWRTYMLQRSNLRQHTGTQYSTRDNLTLLSSSINPEDILASLHSMTLDHINFKHKVLSAVKEPTKSTSSFSA